ncbi:hypothetical protein [Ekhidna sp.]|uniref:hypothetical protein n=1 Tax=Ekhidna sp. TaxID=2608089 RepID=UPI00329A6823
MRDKFLVFALLFTILSCSEEDLPIGLYDYQVERLLSGQSGSKTWMQIVNSTDCKDSVRLHIEFVPNQSGDSLNLSRISLLNNCSSKDTTLIGRANASKANGRDLFTDSLNFRSGDFWIIKNVTSKKLTLTDNETTISYIANGL